ncbi:hypothetical protein BS17DRAFT_785228 [Gyrodon lividus]|nr:hypothetical protein BS17DRAFT_785228 [Gyrodon lividus]
MSRISPSLLYLTIYNPTLRPDISETGDDEDVEEQAQILFYTSRDRAVSRDKILRQVGLAKALVNFAEIFHSTDSCQNVHSQTRRMIMVSPEPNFWMHVAIDLAKTPRPPPLKAKSKDKEKGKAKETELHQLPEPEYHDGSLHDAAIRAYLLRGYEQFKLTHGSYTSILSSLGQQALELQLERFFTVWAWSWDLEKGFSFSVDLGLPLHPLYQTILPVIDTFSLQIPEGIATLVLTHNYVAPSNRYRSIKYPTALARHLMTLLPPTPDTASTSVSIIKPEKLVATSNEDDNCRRTPPNAEGHASNGFLGVSMDVRKWGWPTFGKSPSSSPKQKLAAQVDKNVVLNTASEGSEAQVDQSALMDAISSDNSFNLPAEKQVAPARDDQEHEKPPHQQDPQTPDADTPRPSRVPSPVPTPSENSTSSSSQPAVDAETSSGCEKLQLTSTFVFLASNHEPLATSRRKVYLLKQSEYAVALLGEFGDDGFCDVGALLGSTACLLEGVEKIVSEEAGRNLESSLPSATNILQPKDGHIIKIGHYVKASPESALHPDHLYEAKEVLVRELDVVEVFSRGLHPQHWYTASRAVDHAEDGKEEAYLQISRKEATLSDVDNVLRGLYKSYV